MLRSILVLGCLLTVAPAAAKELKFATLAPKRSPWGKVLSVWAKSVSEKTGGTLTVRIFYGTQGDEQAIVAKMRSGQLDGAAVTSVGLSKIYKNILVLQMPGLFGNWSKLDSVRDAMKPELERGATAEGFTIAGWGDVGLVRYMSKGKAVTTPADLKELKVFGWNQDAMVPTIARTLGYTPILKSAPDLLPALQAGQINAMAGSSAWSTQMQWTSELDHVNKDVIGVAIGGIVFSNTALEGLTGEERTVLLDTAKVAGASLTKRIRNEDTRAYNKLASRMTVVTWTAAQKAEWKQKFRAIRRALSGGTFPADLVSKVESLAGVK